MTIAAAIAAGSLITALEGVGPVREQAIDSLASKGKDVATSVLDSVNWRGRDAVVSALERAKPPAMQKLLEIARDYDKIATRRAAIRSLGKVGPPGTCDSLTAMFGSGSDAVILDALSGRTDCRRDDIAGFLDAEDRDSRRRAFVAYSQLDRPGAFRVAVSKLEDPDHSVRHVAAAFLVGMGGEAVHAIEASLSELDTTARTAALMVLGRIPGQRSEAILVSSLSEVYWPHRRASAIGIGKIGRAEHLDLLRDRLGREQHPIVVEALLLGMKDIEGSVE